MAHLKTDIKFPDVEKANSDGVLAIGGDLSPERLLVAYQNGIFPWFEANDPIIWWAPNPRMVLFLDELKISKSMRNVLNKNNFRVTYNQNFREVISNCQQINRNGQIGTWITNEMLEAYCNLHTLGHAKSIEVWENDTLVGGLYGVDLGRIFCGESMFSKVSNASKIAFVYLVNNLITKDYILLDCQVYNSHLESLGAREIERKDFMAILKSNL